MNWKRCLLLFVLFAVMLTPGNGFAQRNRNRQQRGNDQAQKQKAEEEKRWQSKKNEYETQKAREGLKEWSLTGTMRGTGSTVQFIPDKGTGDVDKEIGAIMIGGKVRTKVEALLNTPLDQLNGKKVQLDFFGEPKKSGSRLNFNAMADDIKEWRGASVLGSSDAEPKGHDRK